MKKIIVICIVAAFATACKKDYTCTCTTVDTSGGTTETTVNTYKASSTKKDATAWCNAIPKTTLNAGSISTSLNDGMTCVLK